MRLSIIHVILDQDYSSEEAEEAISDLLDEMARAFRLDEQFVHENADVLMDIINTIVHLTRFNPQDRIGLDRALPVLANTIRELDRRYQATQQAAAITTPEPSLPTPSTTNPQSTEIDEAGPAQPTPSPVTGTSGW